MMFCGLRNVVTGAVRSASVVEPWSGSGGAVDVVMRLRFSSVQVLRRICDGELLY